MSAVQPGWYPDPSGNASQLRYWDGNQWTANTAPAQGAAPAQAGYAQAAPATTIAPGATYAMSSSDKTLRMVAFIFNLLSVLATCWLLIPLAWGIPMTLRSWGIYKGTKPNTVAFGVCDLIFLNIIGGVLLLISQKDA
ncbi:DUF2510 domain-containing protein [Bifidobacterium saguinibicoloris]|uniref:DUF2510 domain-containing protein n=1 Tax=Bifidobacterium saguinibicoloris TaxID=2834433 RepID=UPI001F3A5A9F|nr:DUF2510 domain-containing protein [Bifidobacterium saguinibicoloris]